MGFVVFGLNIGDYLFGTRFIKLRMAGYLGVLLALSAFAVHDPFLLMRGLGIAVAYIAADLVWTYVRDRKLYFPTSSLISGFIIALVLAPQAPWWLWILTPVAAVFSKQVFHFGLPRHIFNPAATALVAASLAYPSAVSWWGVSWSTFWLPLLLVISGTFIISSVKRWPAVSTFFVVHALLSLWALSFAGSLRTLFWDGTTIFFLTVMLPEPMTSNFPGRFSKIAYGIIAALVTWILGTIWTPWRLDPLLAGLLAANLISSLIFLRKK